MAAVQDDSDGVVQAAAAKLSPNAPLTVDEGLGSLARRLRGTKGPPGWSPAEDQQGRQVKQSVTFMFTLVQGTGVPTAPEALDQGWQRMARVSLIDKHSRVISNFHSIPLPALGQKEPTGWVFDKKAAASNVCIVVPPEEDGGEGSVESSLCVELLTEHGASECVACMKLPLATCFAVIKKAGKSRKVVTLTPQLLGGGVLSGAALGAENDGMSAGGKKGKTPPAHHLELEISKTTREHRADSKELPYYVIVPLEGAPGSVAFRKIATAESQTHYAAAAHPSGPAATSQRLRDSHAAAAEDAGGEVEPPPCVVAIDPGASAPFYSTAMGLIDDGDPSVLAAVSAQWKKHEKSLKKEVKKDPAAIAIEFKTMLRQLWPLTQTVQPDTADMRASGAALQASARANLISSFLGMQGDLKKLQVELLTGAHKHRPFHTCASSSYIMPALAPSVASAERTLCIALFLASCYARHMLRAICLVMTLALIWSCYPIILRSELDPTAELTPVKSPSPPPTPKGVEGYGDMLEDEGSLEDINAPSETASEAASEEISAPPPEPAPTDAGAE